MTSVRFTATLAPLLVLLSGLLLTGCSTPNNQSSVYDRSAMSGAIRTIRGQIVSKREVTIKGGTGLGATTGAGVGAIGGSSMGGNANDSAVGAIVGAVIGGTVGAISESEVFAADGYEYVVESKVAGLLTIVMTDSSYEVGENVFITLGKTPKLIKLGQ